MKLAFLGRYIFIVMSGKNIAGLHEVFDASLMIFALPRIRDSVTTAIVHKCL